MQLTFSLYSLAGLLTLMGIGLIVLGIYQRWLYPELRTRHEEAKMTGSQGMDPNVLKFSFKVLVLIVLPALGFLFGDPVLNGYFG